MANDADLGYSPSSSSSSSSSGWTRDAPISGCHVQHSPSINDLLSFVTTTRNCVDPTLLLTPNTYNWAALGLFVIVLMTIGGNVLVCLAVCYKRKLQNMFNYFLVSLALSDMLSATIVMPLSIIKETIDQFPVPKLICVAWYSLDVLFTSSTICHLCMISIDRYMTLTYPLRYGHSKKKKHTILKIAVVWLISFCIGGPLFILSMNDDDTEDDLQYKGCGPETPVFVISASVTSFFLPLLIMTVMYALTVNALQKQLKEQRRLTVTKSSSAYSSPRRFSTAYGAVSRRGPTGNDPSCFPPSTASCLAAGSGAHHAPRAAVIRQIRADLVKPSDYTRSDDGSNNLLLTPVGGRIGRIISGGGGGGSASPISPLSEEDRGRFLMVGGGGGGSDHLGFDHRRVSVATTSSFVGSHIALHDLDSDVFSSRSSSVIQLASVVRSPPPPTTTTTTTTPASPRHLQHLRSFSFRQSSLPSSSVGGSVPGRCNSQRRGSATPDKGRRAVQVLGILFAVFVVCYFPFFAVYVITSTCSPCQSYISPQTLVALEWLAYSGSMFNPIIYHVFNPDFRQAFQNLLHCKTSKVRNRRHHHHHHHCRCCCYGKVSHAITSARAEYV